MTCEQAELRMAELLAGECAPADRTVLERHLLDCGECRGDFELARAGARIEWADVPVPAKLVEATLASFREPPAIVRVLRWATAAAAVFSVAALLILSSRTPPLPATALAPKPREPRRELLATMQEAVVGAMVCKDEDGRPVGELGLKSHSVSVEILDGIAKTTVEENFENHTGRRLEGTFNFPLPSDASISRLALEVNGKIEEGTCLERERAREVFEGIVRRMQDPALLEWQPGGFFKCRVFPIESHATKRVIVAYTQVLPCFRGRMSYVYPLASEKTRTHPPEEVTITVVARFTGGLSKIESTSHHLDVQRKNAGEASMTFRATNYRPNNDFVVTMEPAEEEVRVVPHKIDGEDGYFACFLTPRGEGVRRPAKYAFVVDASASISAPKLEVAKRLVHAMMERRIDGDRFEILAHNIEVQRSGEVDLRAADEFMGRLNPIGGSDLLQALLAAGDAEVIYIGKGSPTFGESDASKILEAVKGRRIRTIAVGSDANGQLLEKLGGMMRVSPNDDVQKRVGEIAATLGSPVLSDLKLEAGDAVYEVVGARDLFYGERLVLSGRYRGAATKLVITGRDYRREVEVTFPAKEEANNYVRRLWAQRKVADLLALGESKKAEVTDLGVKYQIMTPYTSFLVLETEQMWKDHQLKREVQKQDEVLGKGKRTAESESGAADTEMKREVTRKIAHRLELAYMSADQKKFDRVIKLCDEILMIDPQYPIARELKEDAEKSRHKEEYHLVWTRRLDELKRLTDDDETPVIPRSEALRFPSAEEWAEISKRLPESVIRTEGSRVDDPVGQIPAPRPDPAKRMDAEEHYRLGERYFTAGDFEKASIEAQKALKLDPDNLSARALYTENQFILGGGKVTPSAGEYDQFMKEALVRLQPRQLLKLEESGRTAEAPLMPMSRRTQVGGVDLPGIEGFWMDNGEVLTGARFTLDQDAGINPVDPTVIGSRKPFAQGQRYGEGVKEAYQGVTGRYARDLEIENQRGFLEIPRERIADFPVFDALRATQDDTGIDIINRANAGPPGKDFFEKSLKVPERAGLSATPPDEEEFPDGKAWNELISKRQPKGLGEMRDEINDEDKVIIDKLRSIRINLDFKNAPLTAVVDYVREISGLNIHIIGIDNPDAEMITVKEQDLALGAALRKLLSDRNKTFMVRDGVVLITRRELVWTVKSVTEENGRVIVQGVGMNPGLILAVSRDSKFVALIKVGQVSAGEASGRVLNGLSVGRILPGDLSRPVDDPIRYLASLPDAVRSDLASRANQQSIRAKMGLKE